MILDVFTATSDADLVKLTDADETSDVASLQEAHKRVLAWGAASWALAANTKGVAPSTAAMLDYLEFARLAIPLTIRPASWGTSHSNTARKKATLLRNAHGGRIAALPAREAVPVDVMRSKAMRGVKCFAFAASKHLFFDGPSTQSHLVCIPARAVCIHCV